MTPINLELTRRDTLALGAGLATYLLTASHLNAASNTLISQGDLTMSTITTTDGTEIF